MEHNANDNKYVKIITDALTTAQEMLANNNLIFEKVLPAGLAEETELKGRGINFMFDNIKDKVASGDSLQPHEVITVNRALVEYVQKVELAQSHFMYMNEHNDKHDKYGKINNNALKTAQEILANNNLIV